MATLPTPYQPLSSSMRTSLMILSAVMLVASMLKLIGFDLFITQFADFGYPSWFVYVVGLIELMAVFLLWTNKYRAIGAMLIGMTMIAAAYSHFAAGQLWMLPVNMSIMGVASWIWLSTE